MLEGFFDGTRLQYTYVEIGTPSQVYFVALDTGSDLFWIPCADNCISCAPQSSPLYSGLKVSSFAPFSFCDLILIWILEVVQYLQWACLVPLKWKSYLEGTRTSSNGSPFELCWSESPIATFWEEWRSKFISNMSFMPNSTSSSFESWDLFATVERQRQPPLWNCLKYR